MYCDDSKLSQNVKSSKKLHKNSKNISLICKGVKAEVIAIKKRSNSRHFKKKFSKI